MAGIFISYRRDDASGHAGRLYDALVARFGRERVFMDIDTLRPGLDFVQALDQAVATADVLLALIGPRWQSVADDEGRRRLDNPDDFVRREVATALARDDILVIPVLVGGAAMPTAAVLPEPLHPLRRRNSVELSDGRWDYDVGRLIETLEPLVEPQGRPLTRVPLPRRNAGMIGVVIVVLLVIAVVGYVAVFRPEGPSPEGAATLAAVQTAVAATIVEQTAVAFPTETDPPTITTTMPASDVGRLLAAEAQKYVGAPYVFATHGPDTFDAGGLVYWVVLQVTGLQTNADPHAQFNIGAEVSPYELRPGDLLFYDTMGGQETRLGNAATHVGIFVAPGLMVSALNPDRGVIESDPFSDYFEPLFLGARRMF